MMDFLLPLLPLARATFWKIFIQLNLFNSCATTAIDADLVGEAVEVLAASWNIALVPNAS